MSDEGVCLRFLRSICMCLLFLRSMCKCVLVVSDKGVFLCF